MDSTDVMLVLRRHELAVLHAVRAVPTPNGLDLIVVFLECTYDHANAARNCLLRLPEVADVRFARHTRGIMYVLVFPDEAAGDSDRSDRSDRSGWTLGAGLDRDSDRNAGPPALHREPGKRQPGARRQRDPRRPPIR
jgi:hypothetical protein